MLRINLCLVLLFIITASSGQMIKIPLEKGWEFKKADDTQWLPADVPGTIHTDLLSNHIIEDPFYGDHESKIQWITAARWDYTTHFNIEEKVFKKKYLELVFEGLDTYASVYLNDQLILRANNMFRTWRINIKTLVLRKQNKLLVRFSPAKITVDSLASLSTVTLPDNPRVYARKAQYNFGWDFAPTMITCGIWKPVTLVGLDKIPVLSNPAIAKRINLIQAPDTAGISFYFEKDGQPIYIKGANWVPADVFLPRVTTGKYRMLLTAAKNAGINMLRVWGGGIYEQDIFYSLCDSLDIMVWQDFMFAGGMVPGNHQFKENVHQEIIDQVVRLRTHPCITLWCGNNEIDEAWHNWDWQQQFNIHSSDSIKMWNDYKTLFRDSIPVWLAVLDDRPYISTSPVFGWGRAESITKGDSHYWGVWWGLEDIDVFETKTGRFVSEYGMQAMPGYETIQQFTDSSDRHTFSPAMQQHQKHPTGYQTLLHYLNRYFMDSSKVKMLSLENYSYLTQCLQYYVLKNIIAIHRSKYPRNMGTMLWQLNDCWPGVSWSIIDYYGRPKGGYYAVKRSYGDIPLKKDQVFPKELQLEHPYFSVAIDDKKILISSTENAKFVYLSLNGKDEYLSDNFFDLDSGVTKTITLNRPLSGNEISNIVIKSLYEVMAHPK